MKSIKFRLKGDYGQFKIPYSNNNPLTYSFITKTALVGMIGAVVGIERNDMRRLFPILCTSLKYSLSFNNEFSKISMSMYACNFDNYSKNSDGDNRPNKSPKPMEYLKNIDWNVYISCFSKDKEVVDIFERFCYNLENNIFFWNPTLGIKQCFCEFSEIEIDNISTFDGNFKTKTFIKNLISNDSDSLIYCDNIPTHQNDSWFNDPKYNVSVYFLDNKQEIESSGEYYKFKNENICLI